MKKIMAGILIVCLLLSLAGCRRRVTPRAREILYETVLTSETTEEPTEQTTEETTRETTEESTEEPTEEPTEATTEEPTEESSEPEATETPTEEPTEESTEETSGEAFLPPETVESETGTETAVPPAPTEPWVPPAPPETTEPVTEPETAEPTEPPAELTVSLNPNRGTCETEYITVTVGNPYGELPVPVYRGYDFLGWFTAEENRIGAEDIFSASEEQTLYARWEYNPFDYWTFFLENTTQKIYACQQMTVYVEFEDHVTASWCSLISGTGSFNVAQNREDPNVDDAWVLEKNPHVILKITDNMGRLPGFRVPWQPGSRDGESWWRPLPPSGAAMPRGSTMKFISGSFSTPTGTVKRSFLRWVQSYRSAAAFWADKSSPHGACAFE